MKREFGLCLALGFLDIVRRIAEASGGEVRIGDGPGATDDPAGGSADASGGGGTGGSSGGV